MTLRINLQTRDHGKILELAWQATLTQKVVLETKPFGAAGPRFLAREKNKGRFKISAKNKSRKVNLHLLENLLSSLICM